MDTGTDTSHPALSGKLYTNTAESTGTTGIDDDGNGYIDDVLGYNFISNNGNVSPTGGHGTQVAGFALLPPLTIPQAERSALHPIAKSLRHKSGILI